MADLTVVKGDVAAIKVVEQITAPADAAMDAGTPVRYDVATGKLTKANGTTAAESRAQGILINTAVGDGATVTAVTRGIVALGAALDALGYDADVYLSDTDGRLADTVGTVPTAMGSVVPIYDRTTPGKGLRVEPKYAVKGARMADGAVKQTVIAGGAAGSHAVAGIAVGDELVSVIRMDFTDASEAAADDTAQYTVAAGAIDNTGGTASTGGFLLVTYVDKT